MSSSSRPRRTVGLTRGEHPYPTRQDALEFRRRPSSGSWRVLRHLDVVCRYGLPGAIDVNDGGRIGISRTRNAFDWTRAANCFQTLWNSTDEIELGRRLRNRATTTQPSVIHGSGGTDLSPYVEWYGTELPRGHAACARHGARFRSDSDRERNHKGASRRRPRRTRLADPMQAALRMTWRPAGISQRQGSRNSRRARSDAPRSRMSVDGVFPSNA
jgi:hypothetical protein